MEFWGKRGIPQTHCIPPKACSIANLGDKLFCGHLLTSSGGLRCCASVAFSWFGCFAKWGTKSSRQASIEALASAWYVSAG